MIVTSIQLKHSVTKASGSADERYTYILRKPTLYKKINVVNRIRKEKKDHNETSLYFVYKLRSSA